MPFQIFERLFNSGIDTKADPRVLTGKLLDLKNGVFTRYGNIRKRNGYERLPAAADAGRALYTRGDELLLSDGESLFTYSEGQQAWYDRGPFHPLALSTQIVSKTSASAQQHADRAEHAGVTVRAWETTAGVVFTVTDTATGAVLAHEQAIATGALPMVRRVGEVIHVAYWDDAANELRAQVVRPGALAASLAEPPVTLAADPRTSPPPAFDISSADGEALLVYSTSTTGIFRMGKLLESGGFEGTLVAEDAGDPIIALAVSWGVGDYALSQLVVATTSTPTVTGYEYEWDSGAGEFTAINTGVLGTSGVRAAIAAAGSDPIWHVWWEEPAVDDVDRIVRSRPWVTVDGPSTPAIELRHSVLCSRGWSVGGHGFVHVTHVSDLQTTYFALRGAGTGSDGTTPVLVARALSGTAGGVPESIQTGSEVVTLPDVGLCADGLYRVALGYVERLDTEAIASTTGSGIPDQLTPVYTEPGVVELAYDFTAKAPAAQVGRSLYLAGGHLQQYDGVSVVEQNFHLYPEGVTAIEATGPMTAGVRAYRVYLGWVNDQGERELSTYATEVQATITATKGVLLTLRTVAHTAKRGARGNAYFVIFRTAADPFDTSPFHQVTSLDPAATGANGFVFNDPDVDTVQFLDNMTDEELVTKPLDPANAGELDNLPGYGSVIASGQDRVFLAGLDDPNKVLYSKLHFGGDSVAFNEALAIQVDEEGGPITGLRMLGETLVIFKERSVYYVTGSGRDNLGAGADYSEANLLVADCGSINQSSIVSGPDGVYFQSAKGIHVVAGAGGAMYVGAPVEAYNADEVTAATLLADVNQIRFLTAGDRTLVFDYFFKQWSTFTNHAGAAAVVWRGTYAYVREDGDVMLEASGSWADAGTPVRLVIETDWIKLAGLQGFKRVRRMGFIGEFRTPHTLRISYAYDYEAGFPYVYTWDPAAVINESVYGSEVYGEETPYGGPGSSVYQAMHGLRKQKCQSVRFRFEDVGAETPGTAFVLTGLALEADVIGNIFRQGEARLIGSAASAKYSPVPGGGD